MLTSADPAAREIDAGEAAHHAQPGEAPLTGNLEGVTAGLFQGNRVRESSNGRPVAAAHDNAFAYEPINLMFTLPSTWREAGAPTIVDPYAELNTPPFP